MPARRLYLCVMELAVKIYPDKPSRIGVLYNHEFMAVRTYEDLVRNNRNQSLHLKLELLRGKAELTFTSSHTGTKTVYRDIEFKTSHIEKIQKYYHDGMPADFVHIFPRGNQLLIAKPFRKAEFLPLTGIQLVLN
jgi:hypothetical protein